MREGNGDGAGRGIERVKMRYTHTYIHTYIRTYVHMYVPRMYNEHTYASSTVSRYSGAETKSKILGMGWD